MSSLIYHYQELHHSQTNFIGFIKVYKIYHYQELHHSQTHSTIMSSIA